MSDTAPGALRTGAVRARVGLGLTVAVVLALAADAATGLFAPQVLASEMASAGFPAALGAVISGLALVCALAYAISSTRTLGAILITGFLGGAICTHLRLGEIGSPPQIVSLVLGVLAWGGLYLHDVRLRALLPFTR